MKEAGGSVKVGSRMRARMGKREEEGMRPSLRTLQQRNDYKI